MKRLLTAFLAIMSLSVYAQPSMLQQGNEWYYNVYCLFSLQCGYMHYAVGEETTAGGFTGSIVHSTHLAELAPQPELGYEILRQSGDTVYRYSPQAEQWHMLYDFGALPGDVWHIQTETYLGYGNEGGVVEPFVVMVDSVSSVEISGAQHRVVYTSPVIDSELQSNFHFGFYAGTIIEGIGPVDYARGLIGEYVELLLPTQVPSFACFLSDGNLLLGSNESPCYAMSTSEATGSEPTFTIYPNPANAQVQLYLHGNVLRKLTLYDIQGREVLSVLPNHGDNAVLDVRHLPKGMYLLRATDNASRVHTRKLVIE